MRKLFISFVVALIAISSFGQGIYTWNDSLDAGDAMVAIDTVIQPKSYQLPPGVTVGGYIWSCTIDAKNVSANDGKVELGGSNQTMADATGPNKARKFNPFLSYVNGAAVFPFTLDKDAMVDTIRSGGLEEITYTKTFYGSYYGFDFPMMRFTKGTNSGTAYIRYYWRFYKN